MKKIYSLFMALCVVLCATANSTLAVDYQVNPAKVTKAEKVMKQVSQEASRQAIAKKMQDAPVVKLNGVREYKATNVMNFEKQKLSNTAKKVAAKKTDDVTTPDTIVVSADIWQYKYYAESFDWYMVIANEANDLIIYLDYFSDDFAGTFTEADLDTWYSYILAVDEEGYANYIDIVEANIVVTDDENGKSADVTILASDGNVYVTYAYEAPLPEPVGEKTLAYTTAELVDMTASSGMWQFWAEENGWYTSIVMASAQVEGEYARVDMADPYYNYLAYFTETDTTIIDMLDINATVTKEGKTYTLVADVLGADAILYHITMSYTRPDPTDTVSIVATDLYIDEFEFWGMVFVTADASNDEYSVLLTANDYLTEGQYGSGDWQLGSCEITDKVTKTTTTLLEANLTVAGEGAARTIVGSVLGADNVLYNLDLSYEIPEVADTVVVAFETPGVAEWYDADGDYFMYNENEDYFVYLDMIADRNNFAGEFTAEDFLLNYTAMGEIADGDTTLIMAADAKAVVTAVGENLVHIDAELTGKNGVLYMVSTDMVLPGKGLKYDAEEGEVNRTYSADEILITTDYVEDYGMLYVELMAGDNSDYTQLVFYVEETVEGTVVPVGTYTIDDSADYGTVAASTGYNANYGPIPSFYSTLVTKEDGLYYGGFFFLVSGTVTVEDVDGSLKITVDGLNSYDRPVHIVYDGTATGSDVEYEMYEDVITNLVIDYDNMLLIGGPSEEFQVEVVLGLGDYDRNTDNFQLLPESSISVLGSEATFIDGIASVDGIAQTALAVVHCMWNGMALEFHLTMSAAALEATVVVVENAAIEIEKYLLWGDMYDYALKMTGVWSNEGVDYPVLVEVPVYYPEATEPYDMYSTVTVGGWGDEDPWLGFGEGYLTITEVDNVITATGVVENPMAGVAIDITISGTKVGTSVENATVTVKAVKTIKNGQLIIVRDGKEYNAQGAKL